MDSRREVRRHIHLARKKLGTDYAHTIIRLVLQQKELTPEMTRFLLREMPQLGELDLFLLAEEAILLHQKGDNIFAILKRSHHWKEIRAQKGAALLFLALRNDNADLAQKLLEEGISPHSIDVDGNSPLMIALLCQQDLIVQNLLNDSTLTNINHQNQHGYTALHLLHECTVETLREMLAKGADPKILTRQKETPLLLAARYNRPAEFLKMLCPDTNTMLQPDIHGNTPLLEAVRLGNLGNVHFLTPASSGKIFPKNAISPLVTATILQREEILLHLLKKGFSTKGTDRFGRTAMHWAALHNNLRFIQILLKYGADPLQKDAIGLIPLDIANIAESKEAAALLQHHPMEWDNEAKIALHRRNMQKCLRRPLSLSSEKRTLLKKLIVQGKDDLTEILQILDGLPDLTPQVPTDPDFVHLAVHRKNPILLRYILASRPPLNRTDKQGKTPLQVAIDIKWKEGITMLCQYNASVSNKQARLSSVLPPPLREIPPSLQPRIFLQAQNASAISYLLNQKQISPNHPLDVGESVLFQPGLSYSTLLLLLNNGANPNVCNAKGDTPLAIAIKSHVSLESINLLLSYGATISQEIPTQSDIVTRLCEFYCPKKTK